MAPKRPLSSQVPPAKRMRGSNGSNPSPKDAIIILDEERDSVFGKYIDLTADEPFTPPRSSCKATSKSFRFMDLPAELRVSVYRCLLPSGMKIQFRRRHADNVKQRSQQNFVNGWVWNTIAWDKSGTQVCWLTLYQNYLYKRGLNAFKPFDSVVGCLLASLGLCRLTLPNSTGVVPFPYPKPTLHSSWSTNLCPMKPEVSVLYAIKLVPRD